jgi:hygromycin-B 7''-O-kinase
LVYEYINGESIRAVFDQLTLEDRLNAAGQLGGWVKGLHDLPLPAGGPFDDDWSGFQHFLENQRARPVNRHNLPAHLSSQIEQFIPPIEELLNNNDRLHLIHADLTGDHLLGQWINGRWQASALIDFGDARTGNFYYELAALHLDMFQCDRRLLSAFLKDYGLTPTVDFSRLALSFCLLHEFEVLDGISLRFPVVNDLVSLQDLADLLFSLPPG